MPRATGCVKTGCNRSFAVRSILSNGGNCNLCLVATYLQVQSSCSLLRVAQLDFQTLSRTLKGHVGRVYVHSKANIASKVFKEQYHS
jgi:hypothetical protein